MLPPGARALYLHGGDRKQFPQLVSVTGLHQDALFRRSRVAAVPPSPERPTGARGLFNGAAQPSCDRGPSVTKMRTSIPITVARPCTSTLRVREGSADP
jgi:hypothetical protein